jgi:hypothetical protein
MHIDQYHRLCTSEEAQASDQAAYEQFLLEQSRRSSALFDSQDENETENAADFAAYEQYCLEQSQKAHALRGDPSDEEEDCMAGHPYVLREEEERDERERREAEKTKGHNYTTIPFRTGEYRYGGLGYPLSELSAAAPGLKPILQANTSGEKMLTVATCALVPELIDAPYRARPLWVMHMPGLPDTHLFGDSGKFGVTENQINACIYLDPLSRVPRLYLSWGVWKTNEMLVPIDPVFESLKDADAGEGSIVIAFIGQEGWEIGPRWIPVGLLQWLEEKQLLLARWREFDWNKAEELRESVMRVRHIPAL